MGMMVGVQPGQPIIPGTPPGPSQARQAAPLRKVLILSPVSY